MQNAIKYRTAIVDARIDMALTQGKIAQLLGISTSSYQKYEYGQRTPRNNTRVKINELLGVTDDHWFADREDEEDYESMGALW